MTPTQQAALQAVYTAHGGGTFSAQQVTDLTPLVTARNDAAVAAYLSPGLTVQGMVPISSFLGWAASTGMRAVIEDAAHSSASPYYATLRSSALAMLDIIANKTDLDLSSSAMGQGNLAMLGAWVTAGAINSAQEAALVAMAKTPNPITYTEISAALNGA
ncbi:MAG: hypothetical protein KGM49_15680 [Sphingomonadales bacterium]|nr:hypothetical protein [Sphingomonadales bacterium]